MLFRAAKSGFSLIELLVVVAIIGILATVGIVGFRAYIDVSKDAVTSEGFNFIQRQLNADLISLRNDLSARSGLADNLSVRSQCYHVRDEYIKNVNAERTNPFNETQGAVCDGNYLATGPVDNGTAGRPTTVKLIRGQTMVYCSGTDLDSAMFAPVTGVIGLNYCTCTALDSCETSLRRTGRIATSGITDFPPGTRNSVRVDISSNVPESKKTPYPANIQIGGVSYVVGASSAYISGLNVWDLEILGSLPMEVSDNDTVTEVGQGICFTPIGATDNSSYFGTYSNFNNLADMQASNGACATTN